MFPQRVPARVADCFLFAMTAFMRRHGQGAHITASVLELPGAPDLARLRPALRRIVAKHPLLAGRLRRDWRTWLPYWEVREPAADAALPLDLWHEPGAPGALGSAAREVESAHIRLRQNLGEPLLGGFHARLDVIERRDGSCLVALSWAHTLIDGKGAELLLAELGRLCAGIDEPCTARENERPATTWREKIAKTKPAINHLEALGKNRIASVCGPRPRPGRGVYQIITLDAAATALVRERVERTTGALFPLAFFVACAARAHDRVLEHRGRLPEGYVTSVPIQTRRRGARGPLFQNHVTVLFFGGKRDELATLESAATAARQQFSEMSRARLDESFTNVLELMMRVPPWLFMFIVRRGFRGEICSFFQSHTGPFAPELVELAGARVTNAYHLPCVSAPPGSGIFFAEHGDRLNVTVSWREGSLSDSERRVLVARVLEDLVGKPMPELIDAGL